MGAHFAHHSCVRDVMAACCRDIIVLNGFESVGTVKAFLGGIVGAGANALAESSKFICVGGIPDVFVAGVSAELAVFEQVASGCIQDWECVCRGGRVGVTVCLGEERVWVG